MEDANLKREGKEHVIRKRVSTSKRETLIREGNITSQAPKKQRFFLEKLCIVKNLCKYSHRGCGKIRYYANECKNRKNNTLGSLDYFELSVEEILDLTLKTIKKKSDYEETSHIIKSSSITLKYL